MVAARSIFGVQAFRKYNPKQTRRSQVSKALFEAWSVNLDKLDDRQLKLLVARKKRLMGMFADLMDDTEFMNAISYSTGDSRRVMYRFKKIEEIIREAISD